MNEGGIPRTIIYLAAIATIIAACVASVALLRDWLNITSADIIQFPSPSTPFTSNDDELCPGTISQGVVYSWSTGVGNADVAVVDKAIKEFNLSRDPRSGNFVVGDIIPKGVIVATNFDERDADKWKQYPVIPIVHSGSWGLFQTDGEYRAPNAGACLSITP